MQPRLPAPSLAAPDRSGHRLDRPDRSDELRSPLGGVALTGFPAAASSFGQLFVDGWLAQTEVFTVQDHVAELAALRRAADTLLEGDPSLLQPEDGLRELASLSLAPGTTPGGRPATSSRPRSSEAGPPARRRRRRT